MKISELMDHIADDSVKLTELPQVSHERIKEATMKKVNESDQKQRNGIKRKAVGGIAVALVTCVLCGTAYAMSDKIIISDDFAKSVFHKTLGEEEEKALSNISAGIYSEVGSGIVQVESNGTKVTRMGAIYDGFYLYLHLKIEAPEGTVLKDLDRETEFYQLFGKDEYDFFSGVHGYSGGDLDSEDYLIDTVPEDNVIEIILEWRLNLNNEKNYSVPKVFHFEGLWIQDAYYGYTQILSGDFNIPLDDIVKVEPIIVNTKEIKGLGSVAITPLGGYGLNRNHGGKHVIIDGEDVWQGYDIELGMKDGTTVKMSTEAYQWEKVVDLEQVEYVMVDGVKIPIVVKKCIRTELKKALWNKMALSAYIVMLILAVWQLIGKIDMYHKYLIINADYKGNPMLSMVSLFDNWLGADGITFAGSAFYFLLPLLTAFPYGWSLAGEIRSGYIKNVLVRISRREYFASKYIAVFCSAALVAGIPLLVNLLAMALFLPALKIEEIYPYGALMQSSMWSGIYYEYPFLYAFLYILLDMVFVGLIASISTACALFLKYKVTVLILPFLLMLGLDHLDGYNGSWDLFPDTFMQAFPVAGNRWGPEILAIGILLLVCTAGIVWRKGRRYEVL